MKISQFLTLLVVLMLVVALSACDVIETVLRLTPQAQPTAPRVATSVPGAQTTPGAQGASPTPPKATVRIPTGAPLITPIKPQSSPIPAAQVSEWGNICNQTTSLPASNKANQFRMGSAAPLVLEEKATQWMSQSFGFKEVSANQVEDVSFLICIRESSEHAFNYTGSTVEGRRRIWNVHMVVLANQEVFYTSKLVGANPPSFTTVTKGTTVVMGADPTSKVLDVLYAQFTEFPPLADRNDGIILSLTFSPDGKYLLVTSVDIDTLTFTERALSNFGAPVRLVTEKTWKPGINNVAAAYTPDAQGLVVSDLINGVTNLYYLKITRSSAISRLDLVGTAPCFGVNCEVGPILGGNVIRRGDCEWKLDTEMNCKSRVSLPGGLIASSENGEWLLFGAEFSATRTPTLVLSRTPTLTRSPIPSRTASPRPGSIIPSNTPVPTATRTTTSTRLPTLTRTPLPELADLTLWNSSRGVLDWRIPAPPTAQQSTTKILNPPEVVFAPNGTFVAVKFIEAFEIWDLSNGSRVASLSGYTSIAFSPDGLTLVGASSRSGVDVFDLKALHFKTNLAVDIGPVQMLAYSADGSRLAVSSGRFVQVIEVK